MLLLIGLVAAFGPTLDDPVKPSMPTIRSEIRRGVDAAWDCHRFGSFAEMEIYQRCIDAAQSDNRQRMGTAFEAFDVGLYRVARDHMAEAVDVLAEQPTAPIDRRLVKAALDVEEAGYERSRQALGLSEAQVDSVVYPGRVAKPRSR